MKDRFNKSQYLLVWLVVLALLAGGLFTIWYFFGQGDKEEDQSETTPSNLTQQEFEEASSLSTLDITGHDLAEDCWIGYSDKVYEVTGILDTQNEIKATDCGKVIDTELSQNLIDELAKYEVARLSD